MISIARLFVFVVAGVLFPYSSSHAVEHSPPTENEKNHPTLASCHLWSPSLPPSVGVLDHTHLPEASGLVVSQLHSDRLYHINDSGEGPVFYQTRRDGSETKKVKVENWNPKDPESLGYGPCPIQTQKPCIVIGDIGDNQKKRKNLRLAVIREELDFGSSVNPLNVIKIRYPDGRFDAEAMEVHPVTGDLYLMTKTLPTRIYRLSQKELARKSKKARQLEWVGNLAISYPTGLSLSPRGEKFLLLTYGPAFEVSWDLSHRFPKSPLGFLPAEHLIRTIPLIPLRQQESIAYLNSPDAFLYSTENPKRDAVLIQMNCAY